MNDIKVKFNDHLDCVYERIEKIIENLTSVHSDNIKFLNNQYEASVEKLHRYKEQISNIIIALLKNSQKFYFEKLSEIYEMDQQDLDEEKKAWNFKEPTFTRLDLDPYKFEDFRVFKSWQQAEVKDCEHQQREIIVTFCKNGHCKTCLETLIRSGQKTCPCKIKLSPKNVHEIMGFTYRLDEFFKT